MTKLKIGVLGVLLGLGLSSSSNAQELLPIDNGMSWYHASPRFRASEEHPFRLVSYVAHPIGWVAREIFTRPISYFASSTELTRSLFGFREPYDYRQPDCFVSDSNVTDCRAVPPYNYAENVNGGDMVDPELAQGIDGALVDPAAVGVDGSVASTTPGMASGDQVAALASPGGVQADFYLPDVNFEFNRSVLSELGKGKIRQVANALKNSSATRVVLQGHTDGKGTDTYNEKLGLARAEAVKAELLALGVPAEKLASVSFGKTQPVFPQDEGWANAVNRRVSVTLE